MEQNDIDQQATNKWLTTPGICAETEGFVIAFQGRIIKTMNYSKYVQVIPDITDKCRRCFQPEVKLLNTSQVGAEH